MPLFKRKNKTTIAELEEYYANQEKNRSSKAWFMALVSILITLLVLAGLFFAGRWLYRTVTNDDVEVTSTGEVTGSVPSFGEIRTDADSSDEDTNDTTDSTNSSGGVVSDEAASTTRDVAGSNTDGTNDTEDTPSAGSDTSVIPSTTKIPNTGANELIALLPLIAAVSGYFFSRKRQLSNQ